MSAIDFSKLTMGEIAQIESLSGQSIASIESADAPKGLALAALAYIAKRRSGSPEFTWNEAQALTMADVTEILGLSDDAPKAPKTKGPGKTA